MFTLSRAEMGTTGTPSRYRFVERVVRSSVRKKNHDGERSVTERIDAVATHRVWAIPVFLGSAHDGGHRAPEAHEHGDERLAAQAEAGR